MFKRKHPHGEAHPHEPIPEEALEGLEERTTCYPQDAQAPPPVIGQPRTTVYRQAAKWNRGGYDTVN
jgi:hypothetical protein